MKTALLIWQARLRSVRNTLFRERHMSLVLILSILITVLLGIWSAGQLFLRVQQWQASGEQTLTLNLWWLCISIWCGLIFLTVIGVLQAFGKDETLLLFLLPLTPSLFFRSWYVSFLLTDLWNWLLLQCIVMSYALFPHLGWQALPWLILLQLGAGASILCTLIATLLSIRYLMPRGQIKARLSTLAGVLLLCSFLLLVRPQPDMHALLIWMIVIFGLVLSMGLGPLAPLCGKLCAETFHVLQSLDRAHRAKSFPLARAIQHQLEWRRTLTAALLVRAILSQGRNVLFWLRLLAFCVLLGLFPAVRTLLAPLHIAITLFVTAYAATLAIVAFIENTPNALSGEGNRFTLYLTMPLASSHILYAKLKLFLWPALTIGITLALLLGWYVGLSLVETSIALLTSALMIIGVLTWLVLGSAWDLDLNMAVEGREQQFLQEEVPFSPRRMGLFNLGIGLFVGMFALVWQLPTLPALCCLFLLDGIIVISMQHFSNAHIHRLLRRG